MGGHRLIPYAYTLFGILVVVLLLLGATWVVGNAISRFNVSFSARNSTAVAILVAAAAIWYTFETTRLRFQGARQQEFLERQSQLALVPFIACQILSPIDVNNFPILPNDLKLVESMRQMTAGRIKIAVSNFRITPMSGRNAIQYQVVVDNPSRNVAQAVMAMVYDATNGQFWVSENYVDYLGPNESEILVIGKAAQSFKDVDAAIEKLIGLSFRWRSKLEDDSKSFVAVIFQTLDGSDCMVKRHFHAAPSGELTNELSMLFW